MNARLLISKNKRLKPGASTRIDYLILRKYFVLLLQNGNVRVGWMR